MVRLIAFLFVLAAVPASAQTVPGDCVSGTNNGIVQSGAPIRFYWCQPSTPTNNLTGAKISGLPAGTIQLNNVRIERVFSDGMTQWSGVAPAQPRGNYTVIIYAQNYKIPGDANTVQESKGSSPFALGVVDGVDPPDAPIRIRTDPGYPVQSAAPTRQR